MNTFKPLHRDCPICQGARKDCRQNLNTGIIHCRDASANPGGQWRYIKDDAHGFGMWVWGEGKDARDSRPVYVPKPSNVPSVASWSVADRDRAYRAMGGKLALADRVSIAKRPNVTPAIIDSLVARGWLWTWQGGQAVDGAHVGLPGVKGDGCLTYRQTWAIGVPDVYGEIAGVQLKNPDGGYLWASAPNYGGATPHVDGQSYPRDGMPSDDGGELPLGLYGDQDKFVISAPGSGVANVAEGYFKPALAHCLYGGLWVGMAGGRWDKASHQLQHAVRVLDIHTIILNPDAGAIHNPSVMRAYRAFAKMLGDWPHIDLKVRWWGQSTKDDGDIDEISPETFLGADLLTWAEFEKLSPEKELSDSEKRSDATRRTWLASVAEIADSQAPFSRDAIARDFAERHTLSGPTKVGDFEALEYPGSRKLTILDGQKMTRKTSVALRSVVTRCESLGLSGVVYAPTRVLSRSLAQVLGGAYTIDQYLAMPTQYRPLNPWIVACPESAWKLADLEFDVVIFDEANESLPRAQSGILGNRPKQSRDVIKAHLAGCHWGIIAQDGIYRPTVAAVQRWGEFTPDQCDMVRRERKATAIEIVLYQGLNAETESWDGLKLPSQEADVAFYSWFNELVSKLKAGQRVIIPCGAEGKGRAIHRVLRSLFPEKKGQTIDGKYTPQGVRSAFADNPSEFAKARGLDWLIYSPTFDSGVSIEGTYFNAQFEYIRAFEPATNASQRGERYRDAIKGDKLTERHVYIAQRGLPSMPPVDVFRADYWRALLTNPADTEVINLAQQIGGDSLARQIDAESPDDWLELPEFLAIQARETYFKPELLTQEWQRNGWDIVPGEVYPEAVTEWAERFYQVNQGIIATKARAWAKATPKPLKDGVDVAGPIEATKAYKWGIAQQIGTDFDLLNNPEFAESWVIAGDNSLQAAQAMALLRIAHTNPDLWQAIGQSFALSTVAKATGDETPDLPCSHRVYAVARLLATAPGLWQIASGATPEWTNKGAEIIALADWARQNAHALARLSAHSQRIYGLQFTAKTPAIKCVHRLLQMVGCEAAYMDRAGSGARERRYRLVSLPDIEAKLAQKSERTDDTRRRLYRESTKDKVLSALARVIETRSTSPEWAALRDNLLARYTPSTTSVTNNPSTEVVDVTPKPTHRWMYMGLDGWLDRLEDGAKAIFRTVAGNIYTLSPDDIQAIV